MSDDEVPPLEAARSKSGAAFKEEKSERIEATEEKNAVAEAMMQRALAAREQKKKDTEESRRKADGFGGGLKKGFLSAKALGSLAHYTHLLNGS